MNKLKYSYKIILLATLPVLFFSLLTVFILYYYIDRFSENVSLKSQNLLLNLYSEMIDKKSEDIAQKISIKIDNVLNELMILHNFTQKLIDDEKLTNLLTEQFIYNPIKKYSFEKENSLNIGTGIWANLHNEDGTIQDETLKYLSIIQPAREVLKSIAQSGEKKGWSYIIGPKEAAAFISYPWINVPEAFIKQYPNYDNQNWYDFFFPGSINTWNKWISSADFDANNPKKYITWTPLYDEGLGTGLMISFFSPLWDKSRTKNFGSVGIDYNIEFISDLVKNQVVGENGYAFIKQEDGNIIGLSKEEAKNLGVSEIITKKFGITTVSYNLNDSEIKELKQIVNSFDKTNYDKIYTFRDLNNIENIITFEKINDFNLWNPKKESIETSSFYVVLVVPKNEVLKLKSTMIKEIEDFSDKSSNFLLVLTIAFAILTIVISSSYAFTNTKQIRKILEGIKQINQQNYHTKIDVIAKDDLKYLTESFNNMIDEINRSYEELEQNSKQLLEQQATLFHQSRIAQIGEILQMVSHHWKQPLNSISAMIQLIVLKYLNGTLDETTINRLKSDSLRLVDYMAKTLDDFKDFNVVDIEETLFHIDEEIKKALELVAPTYEELNIKIIKDLSNNCSLVGYPSELIHCFFIILNNAKDALVEKIDSNEKIIKISLKHIEDAYQISIENNGDKISKENMEKLFTPYFTTKSKTGGTGIGLYIAQKIISVHFNGKIEVQNSKNGVRFDIFCKKR